jgi:hypothetical protein
MFNLLAMFVLVAVLFFGMVGHAMDLVKKGAARKGLWASARTLL